MFSTVPLSTGSYIHGSLNLGLEQIFFTQNNVLSGTLRFNPVSKFLEVFNGHSWSIVNTTLSINMTHDANQAIDWAIQKMNLEKEARQLAETNDSVKSALDNLNNAQEQLDIILTLIKNDEELKNV